MKQSIDTKPISELLSRKLRVDISFTAQYSNGAFAGMESNDFFSAINISGIFDSLILTTDGWWQEDQKLIIPIIFKMEMNGHFAQRRIGIAFYSIDRQEWTYKHNLN